MMSMFALSMLFVMVPRAAASAGRINEILEIKPQILALLKEWEDTFLQDLSVEERTALLDLLKKIGHSIFDNPRCGMCNNNCC